jgi:hypothetical protein
MRLTTPFDARHPYLMAGARLAAGIWLFILFALLLVDGAWWGVVLLLPAAFLVLLATRVLQNVR